MNKKKQIVLSENLRLINDDLTKLSEVRPDILHLVNDTMNNIILLRHEIEQNLPEKYNEKK